MKRSRNLILASIVLVIVLTSAALSYLIFSQKQAPKGNGSVSSATSGSTVQDNRITLTEVAKHTGKDGNTCWVVVDDTVYEIGGFALWADGVHSSSGGRARCGKDLSKVILQSPHGKSKLKLLKEVGPYKHE